MPNILIISLSGSAVLSRDMYPRLFAKLLSRAAVHESFLPEDALYYMGIDWPQIILVSDSVILDQENERLLEALTDQVKHGCTTVFMGTFAATAPDDQMNSMFKERFGLEWRIHECTSRVVRLWHKVPQAMIGRIGLVSMFAADAVFLRNVPTKETVYVDMMNDHTYAAFARVGYGKLGYIGDLNTMEEPERLILGMCQIDWPADAPRAIA